MEQSHSAGTFTLQAGIPRLASLLERFNHKTSGDPGTAEIRYQPTSLEVFSLPRVVTRNIICYTFPDSRFKVRCV